MVVSHCLSIILFSSNHYQSTNELYNINSTTHYTHNNNSNTQLKSITKYSSPINCVDKVTTSKQAKQNCNNHIHSEADKAAVLVTFKVNEVSTYLDQPKISEAEA